MNGQRARYFGPTLAVISGLATRSAERLSSANPSRTDRAVSRVRRSRLSPWGAFCRSDQAAHETKAEHTEHHGGDALHVARIDHAAQAIAQKDG